ncbi:uncharacterized protein LOC128667325 [Microplitis demolitor]|uniref:uncharacterized protein LOC128667325 n=1 Tax=Microplitis demolitor TaxID=69319 RepID=UPI00235B6818|nr:uncharacterized protein LOC128667325 [Microplitis demolitor]
MACSVIIHTTSQEKNGSIIGDVPKHQHAGDITDIKAKVIRANLKLRAVNSDNNPLQVIADTVKNANSPVMARLGRIASMQRLVQRARHEIIPQVDGNNISDFILRDDLKMTEKNQLFLHQCEIWCGDGTFRSVPVIFKQLYSLHGVIDGHTLPLVYVLSPCKSQSTYLKILKKIKELMPDVITLRWMLTDFELSYINAFKTVFENVDVSGCFFHHTQCIWRHVQSEGLQQWYNKNIRVVQNIKMLMSLAFVPPNDVKEAYDELVKSEFYVENEQRLSGLLDYYESTWIGVLKRNKVDRSAPMFSIELWNCYDSVINEEMKSNNGIEGWHHSFNALVRIYHANLSKFISVLRTEQTIVELKLNHQDTGVSLPKRRRNYREYDARLKNVVAAYDPNNKLQYLKNVANVLRT